MRDPSEQSEEATSKVRILSEPKDTFHRKLTKLLRGFKYRTNKAKGNRTKTTAIETTIVQITTQKVNHRTGMKCTGTFYGGRISKYCA